MLSLKMRTRIIRKNNRISLISSNPSKKLTFRKIKASWLNLKNSLNRTKPNYSKINNESINSKITSISLKPLSK
jgi:hypothetical protein